MYKRSISSNAGKESQPLSAIWLAGRQTCGALPYVWRQKHRTLHRPKGLGYSLNTCRNVLWLQGGVRARVPETKPGFPYSGGWPVMEISSYLPTQCLAALLSACVAHRHEIFQLPPNSSKLQVPPNFETSPWAGCSAEPTQCLCGAHQQRQRANWCWRPPLHSMLLNYGRDLYMALTVSLKE